MYHSSEEPRSFHLSSVPTALLPWGAALNFSAGVCLLHFSALELRKRHAQQSGSGAERHADHSERQEHRFAVDVPVVQVELHEARDRRVAEGPGEDRIDGQPDQALETIEAAGRLEKGNRQDDREDQQDDPVDQNPRQRVRREEADLDGRHQTREDQERHPVTTFRRHSGHENLPCFEPHPVLVAAPLPQGVCPTLSRLPH